MKNSNNELEKENKLAESKKEDKLDDNIPPNITKKIKREGRVHIVRVIINCIFSIFILALIYFVINNYEEKWKIFYFMTIWSFFMNGFYIVSVTVIDLIRLIKYKEYCVCFGNFVRKHYIRICFPFSISIVFLYWLLILLGDEFEYNSRSLWDNLIAFCFHGLQFIFLLHDVLSYPHQVNINKKFDIIILSIMAAIYFLILGFGKYMVGYEPYDFMEMSNVRQIIGSAILIYIAILDGYVVFVLIAGKCFVNKNIDMSKIKSKLIEENNKINEKEKEKEEKDKIDVDKKENKIENEQIREKEKEDDINKNKIKKEVNNINNEFDIILPKGKKKTLKPIQFKGHINNIELNENKN